MKFIDTHSHLFSEKFKEDIEEVVDNAIKNDVYKILLPNIDFTTSDTMHELEAKYPTLFHSMMGIHPCYVTKDYKNEVQEVANYHQKNNYVAVGEIGIDLYWEKELLHEQTEAFRSQVRLAIDLNLPIAVHVRDSWKEVFKVLDDENCPDLKGVLHCFTGDDEAAKKVLGYGGFKLGVGGVLTYKNSGLDKVIKNISLDHLVLETDSPYLSPTPHRGKRNESSFLIHIAEKLAEVKSEKLDTIAEVTTHNAIELFKLVG